MHSRKRAQILILVLMVMGVGMIVISPMLAMVDTSLRLSNNTRGKIAAYYAAEAGVEHLIGDLYQGINIMEQGYNPIDTINGYTYNATAEIPEMIAPPPAGSEIYLDPGGCFGLRPLGTYNTNVWDYTIILAEGEDVKVNWAGYTSDPNCDAEDDGGSTEHCLMDITLYDEDMMLIGNMSDGDGDKARITATTLFIDGADPGPDGEWDTWDDIITIEGGLYTIRFRNRSYLDDGGVLTNVSACGQPFKRGGDDDYTFQGSITDNFAEFINASGYITLLAFNEEWGDGARQINTDAISCDYVEIAFNYKNGNISTYNFSGVTQGTGPHYSWTGKQDVGTPGVTSYALGYFANGIPSRLYSIARSEMTDSGYAAIEQRQGIRHHVTPAGAGENACTWHQFTIGIEDYSETLVGNVSSMDLRWYGYQHKAAESADNDPMWLMIWNGQRSFYHILDSREQHAGYSWVKVYQGASKDYLFMSTATDADDNPVVTITCYLRQTPGPSAWWEEQTMEMLSWNVIWH